MEKESILFKYGPVKYRLNRPENQDASDGFDILKYRLHNSADNKSSLNRDLETIKSIGLADIFREGFYKAAERRKYSCLAWMGLAGIGIWSLGEIELNPFLETICYIVNIVNLAVNTTNFISADMARRHIDKSLT